MNVKIFERFRKACDEFFRKKGEFFKSLKEGMNENLAKEACLVRKSRSSEGQYRLESNRR